MKKIEVSQIAKNAIWLNDNTLEKSIHKYQLCFLFEKLKQISAQWYEDSFFIVSPLPIFVEEYYNLNKNSQEKYQYKRKIVLIIGNETGEISWKPNIVDNEWLFQCYIGKVLPPESHIFPLPLITPSLEVFDNKIKITERLYDVFFSGNLNRHRWDLYLGLSESINIIDKLLYKFRNISGINKAMYAYFNPKKIVTIRNSFIRFNKGYYSSGLSPEKYREMTANSKIIISPRGFVSHECYRTYEAMREGCIVVTERLPKVPYYDSGIPLIQVDNWRNIKAVINKILSTPQKNMEQMSKQVLKYYNENLSIEAIANYIYIKTHI